MDQNPLPLGEGGVREIRVRTTRPTERRKHPEISCLDITIALPITGSADNLLSALRSNKRPYPVG